MFWAERFQKLIGFDHRWLVVISIVLTGILFPFIFLRESISEVSEGYGIYQVSFHLIYGIVFSYIMMVGNLYIFLKRKESIAKIPDSIWEDLRQTVGRHVLFIIPAAAACSQLPELIFMQRIVWTDMFASISGTLILGAVLIGVYESAYYMHAYRITLKEQETLKRQNVESQLEVLKNQVKPHFLFNSLNTLINLIPQDPDKAMSYVQNLSTVYRYILEIKDKKIIPLSEELRCIQAYLAMLQVRFGTNLLIHVDEDLNEDQAHIVPLSLQILLENAVKHNIISSKKPLSIKISRGAFSKVIVSNNLQSKQEVLPSTGTGLQNIKDRYAMLSNQNVEIENNGKEFKVALPLIKVS